MVRARGARRGGEADARRARGFREKGELAHHPSASEHADHLVHRVLEHDLDTSGEHDEHRVADVVLME